MNYLKTTYCTENVPTAWYENNIWKINNASAYNMHLDISSWFTAGSPSATIPSYITAAIAVGDNVYETWSIGAANGVNSGLYHKTLDTDVQDVIYGLSGKTLTYAKYPGGIYTESLSSVITWSASMATGTWSATGYAP